MRAPEKRSTPMQGSPRSQHNVAANSSLNSLDSYPESIVVKPLSVALISPNQERRAAAVLALTGCAGSEVSEFSSYPPVLDDVPRLLEGKYDVVIVELDSDPEYALELVESIDARSEATVMVYSENSDPELLVRCMRAGAREFLTLPFTPEVIAETLVRATARRPIARSAKVTAGKLYAFMGSKGGAGTTMVACNFAVGLAKESGQSTLLIDLDLPLGDAALNLGITPEFSTIDALQEVDRLDGRFLSQLLVKHHSGLSVLAAPGTFVRYEANNEAINRLLEVARQEFENVVLDLGSKLEGMGTDAYREATTVYLVTQASIPELRNSNRIITQFFTAALPKMEIVVNRFEPRVLGVTEEHITKALTRPAQWKIPNDYATVHAKQISATPLVLSDSSISRQIKKMVSAVTGKSDSPAKKKGFSFNLFG
jgi:pilus assembly protein CpaE